MSRARNDANRVEQDFTDSRSMTFPREQDQALKRILEQLEAARGTSTVAESDAKPVAKLPWRQAWERRDRMRNFPITAISFLRPMGRPAKPGACRGKGISQAGQ